MNTVGVATRWPRGVLAWCARRPLVAALLCVAAAGLVGVLDLVAGARYWPIAVNGALDEPAHLLTAGLFLAAFLPWRLRALVPWALAGAVLIDLDHIPLYLWGALAVEPGGRPFTHSLATVLVLAAAGAIARGRARTALLGLALGVVLHLVRDLGTGPGVPLWWPADPHSVIVPYAAYFAALLVACAAAVIRQAWRRAARSPSVPAR